MEKLKVLRVRAASQSVDFEKKLFEIPVINVDENIVSEAIKLGQFISYLKLYLIDHLRRCATFKDIKAFTHTYQKKRMLGTVQNWKKHSEHYKSAISLFHL